MAKAAAIAAGLLIALMAMPNSINLLAPLGGEFLFSFMPIVLTIGLVLGLRAVFSVSSATKALLAQTNPWLLVFFALAAVSVVWSAFPLVTLYRLYRLYALGLVCIAFCLLGWDGRRLTRVLIPPLLFLTVGSIIFFFADPQDAIEPSIVNGMVLPELVGAWRGVTLHKNTLGSIGATAAIIWYYELIAGVAPIALSLLGMAAAVVCLAGSRSSTSMFAAAFSIAVMTLILKSPAIKKRRMIRVSTGILVFFFLVYSLGVLNIVPGLSGIIEPLVAMTGKDMTFSGRTTIWAIMKDQIVQHPLLGTGYAAFWLGPDPPSPSYIFKVRMYIYPGEAHNGYLDVINELGVIGIVALVGYLFAYLWQCVRVLPLDRPKGSLCIALLFSELIANMSEAHWWNLASVNFFIMTLVTFDLGRTLLEQRRQVAPHGSAPVTGYPQMPPSRTPPSVRRFGAVQSRDPRR